MSYSVMSNQINFFLLLISVINVNSVDEKNRTVRMIGEKPALHSKWENIATIAFGQYAVCGGALISQRWVLTAAFCVDEERHKNSRIWYGALGVRIGPDDQEYASLYSIVNVMFRSQIVHNSNVSTIKQESVILVEDVIIYPDYSRTEKVEGQKKLIIDTFGIALLKLKEPGVSNSTPILPLSKHVVSNRNCKTAGWGLRSIDFKISVPSFGRNPLQEIDLTIMDKNQCFNHLSKIVDMFSSIQTEKTHFLAGKRCAFSKQQGVSTGDGGDPIVCNGKLRGLIYGTNILDKTSLFYESASFITWIEKHINSTIYQRALPCEKSRAQIFYTDLSLIKYVLSLILTFNCMV